MSAVTQGAPPAAPAPRNANDLRGFRLRRLLAKPWILALSATAAVAAGVGVGIATNSAAIGALAAAVELLLDLVVLFFVADSQAEDDFFRAYASARGLDGPIRGGCCRRRPRCCGRATAASPK